MKARKVVERIRQKLKAEVTENPPDTYDTLFLVQDVMRSLLAEEEFSFFTRHLDPVASTVAGERYYDLPKDFGSNFVRGAEDDGSRYLCLISDGSTEQFLDWVAPEQFFSKDFVSATNAVPNEYTIHRDSNYQPQIVLDPPPDSNSSSNYTIRGMYRPTYDDIALESWVPDPAVDYLIYAVCNMKRPDKFAVEFDRARRSLWLLEARARQSQLAPRYSKDVGVDTYEDVLWQR